MFVITVINKNPLLLSKTPISPAWGACKKYHLRICYLGKIKESVDFLIAWFPWWLDCFVVAMVSLSGRMRVRVCARVCVCVCVCV